jgi:hypothetical protein
MKSTSKIILTITIFVLTACVGSGKVKHYRYKKDNFLFYSKQFSKPADIRCDGVYRGLTTDSMSNFVRFFDDGKVIVVNCYDNKRKNWLVGDACFDSVKLFYLYGYYKMRTDTVFLELDDNVPISNGINIMVCKLSDDTLKLQYEFNRAKYLHQVRKNILPAPGQKYTLTSGGTYKFFYHPHIPDYRLDW